MEELDFQKIYLSMATGSNFFTKVAIEGSQFWQTIPLAHCRFSPCISNLMVWKLRKIVLSLIYLEFP